MNKNQTADYHDTTVDVKVVLGGLWTTMLFVFAYVDIFGTSLFPAGVGGGLEA